MGDLAEDCCCLDGLICSCRTVVPVAREAKLYCVLHKTLSPDNCTALYYTKACCKMFSTAKVLAVLLCCAGLNALPRGEQSQVWKPEFFPSVEQLLSRRSGRPFTISVEGNVGSGKSTVLNFFKQYPDISVYPEPVSLWTNLNGSNYLDLVYKNQTRWGMTFESLVMQTMLEIQMRDCRNFTGSLASLPTANLTTPPVKIMERSLLATRHIFVRNLNNTIPREEFNVLEAWLDRLNRIPQIDTGVDVIIYLRTDPSVTIKRVAKRDRHEELDVPIEYYRGLNQLYEDWLIHGNSTGITHHPRVIVIDANKDISVLSETYKYLAKAIFRSIPKQLRSHKFYNAETISKSD